MNKFKTLFNNIQSSIVNFKLENDNEPIILTVNNAFMNKFTEMN